ncbi:MAG: hypothetical protein FWE20_05000 [Defluviitaleaceae bacterium]|nr:hypothetical protein [Defluviitaleaceae bacterium]
MIAIAKKKKKSSGALVLIILLVCLAIGVTTVFILAMPSQPNPADVIADHAAIDLYELLDEVLAVDLDEDYPQTPEEVMRLFSHTFRLIHGWDRNDQYVISRVLEVQRGLFAQALLDLNPFHQQLSLILIALDELYDRDLEIVGVYQGSPVFHRFSPNDRTSVTVILHVSNGQNFQYIYQLFREAESGRWQIGMWEEVV